MNSKQFLKEGLADEVHGVDQDHEVQMARADCYYAAQSAIKLHKILAQVSEQQGLEGWVSEKITLAADYLKNVCEYMEHQAANPPLPQIDPAMVPPATAPIAEDEEMEEGLIGDIADKFKQAQTAKAAEKAKAEFLARRAAQAKRAAAQPPKKPAATGAWDRASYDTTAKRGAQGRAAERDWVGNMEEGRFTVNAKTGAKLDPRTGAELPPKNKPVTSKQMWADADAAAAKSAGPDLDTVWRKIEDVVGQIFPDGDPIDYLAPWLEKQGVRDFKIGDTINAAVRKHGYANLYDYYDSLKDMYGQDSGLGEGSGDIHEAVDPEFYAALNENIAHILTQHFGGKAWFKGGAYSYQFDVKNPNKMVASDGSVVAITSWAHAIEKYADKWVWQEAQDTFFDTNWQEFFSADQLNEISRDKLVKYADRAISAHGHAAFAARQHQPEAVKKEFEKIRDKRSKGISRAYSDERLGGKLREAKGDTIEAHGIRGMDRKPWRRTFKDVEAMNAWVEKYDAEILGQRELEGKKLDEQVGNVNTDQLLEFLTAAWSTIRQNDMYTPAGKQTISRIYEGLRSDLMQGDFAGFEKAWEEYGAKYPDHLDELAEMAFEEAGLDSRNATYEDFIAAAGSVSEGIMKNIKRGLQGWGALDKDSPKDLINRNRAYDDETVKLLRSPGKTGKGSPAALQQRVLDREAKKRGLDEMSSAGATSVGSIGTVSMPAVKKAKKRIKEMNLAPANSAQAAGATTATKNAIADKLKKSGNTQLAGKLKSGAGTFNKDELDAIVGADATVKPGIR